MIQLIISIIFYMTFIVYIWLAAYGLSLNKKGKINKIFALLCVCISIWSFTFAFSMTAENYEVALLWRRFSVFGWGVIYSIILHFTIILAGKEEYFKKKWLYLAIYIPALINILFFGPFFKSGKKYYHLVFTQAGWSNLPVKGLGDLYFNAYYVLFSLTSILLLWTWLVKAEDFQDKKNSRYIMLSLIISLLVGSLTDIVANRFLNFPLPQLAPVIILIPMLTIVMIVRKYGFMVPDKNFHEVKEGVILSHTSREGLFKGLTFIAMSVAMISQPTLHPESIHMGIIMGLIIPLIGGLIYLIPSYIQSAKSQDLSLMVLMNLLSVIVMQVYFEKQDTNLLWPLPLLIIILTIIFNSRKILFMTSAVSISMAVLTWIRMPDLPVEISPSVYLVRICFYLIGALTIVYVQLLYKKRIGENEIMVEFQKMIASISAKFTHITVDDFDEKIVDMLEETSLFLRADRSYLGIYDKGQTVVDFTHHWDGQRGHPMTLGSKPIRKEAFTWARNQMNKKEIIYISDWKELPEEAVQEKDIMKKEDINAIIYIPIVSDGGIIGFVGYDKYKSQEDWYLKDRELLKVLSNMIAEGLKKIEFQKSLDYLAYYDALTGLPNRVLFKNRLEQAIPKAIRENTNIGIILLDLDGFKDINDTFGHDWGDKVLIEVGKRLKGCVRTYDTVARFGGDEFLLMLPQIENTGDLEIIGKKIIEIFRHPVVIKKHEFYISVSMGITLFPIDGEVVNQLLKNADMAMYHAKNNGKGQFTFCTSDMKDHTYKTMALTNSLYRALENNELTLNYQPKVCLWTGEVIGMEALIRWDHPEHGRISPAYFIPIAEQTGLIHEIGEWVIRTACWQNKQWMDMGLKPVQIAVNLSLEQFKNRSMYGIVKKYLEENQLEAGLLEIEITEGIAMKESTHIIEELYKIRDLGVSIAIDDFGTEYSSLSRLKELPIDRLKMDIRFIRGIGVSAKDESIISVIIHLAKSLGLKVIAEGVENRTQLDFLMEAACDEVQGYYYYKPMRVEEIEKSLIHTVNR